MNLNPFRKGTQLYVISEMLLAGKSREEIFRETYPLVLSQSEPFIFSDNVNGSRIPKAIHDQIPLLFYAIGRVRKDLLAKSDNAENFVAKESRESERNYGSKAWRAALYNRVKREYEAGITEPIDSPEPEPFIPAPNGIRAKLEYLQTRLNEIRSVIEARKVGGKEFDSVSTRAFVYGKRAILAGIEPDDFLWSIGANWPEDAKNAAKLNFSVDYSRYALPNTPRLLGFIVKLMECGIPVYLCGPTGSGKSVLARMAADHFKATYGEIPLSLGVSRTDLFGNWNAKGFVNRPFTEIYGNGGVFNFEEIDAADPNILLAVNNAIANDSLFNSSNGEEIKRSENFSAISTANTWGNGATSNFGGREGLDGSTLDRFKYGRVYVDYDPTIEAGILFGDIEELEAAENALVTA